MPPRGTRNRVVEQHRSSWTGEQDHWRLYAQCERWVMPPLRQMGTLAVAPDVAVCRFTLPSMTRNHYLFYGDVRNRERKLNEPTTILPPRNASLCALPKRSCAELRSFVDALPC